MNSTRRSGLNSTALALIPLAIAINIAVGQIVQTLKLPLYLDSIGTVLVGALLGPWMGLLTGALANVIWTLTGLPPNVPVYPSMPRSSLTHRAPASKNVSAM